MWVSDVISILNIRERRVILEMQGNSFADESKNDKHILTYETDIQTDVDALAYRCGGPHISGWVGQYSAVAGHASGDIQH